MKARDIGRYVHLLTMQRVEAGEGEYYKCFRQVLDEDPELKAIYAGTAPTSIKRGPEIKAAKARPSESLYSTSSEIDSMVKRYMFETNIEDYAVALRHVLRSNPAVAKRYSQV